MMTTVRDYCDGTAFVLMALNNFIKKQLLA